MVLGYAASILAVKQNNETGDRKVTNIMYSLCLAEILIIAMLSIFWIISLVYRKCNGINICAATVVVMVPIAVTIMLGFYIGYDALIIYRYKNNEDLTNSDLVFSKVYIALFTIMLFTASKKDKKLQ
jgi:hypothetical protein